MAWFKVDDAFWSHPKVLPLSLPARGLWVTAGAYCAAHLTDGFISSSVLPLITGMPARNIHRHADELVNAGLWDPADGTGWWFHDWHDHQPTRAQVHARRQAGAERLARWRANHPDV